MVLKKHLKNVDLSSRGLGENFLAAFMTSVLYFPQKLEVPNIPVNYKVD